MLHGNYIRKCVDLVPSVMPCKLLISAIVESMFAPTTSDLLGFIIMTFDPGILDDTLAYGDLSICPDGKLKSCYPGKDNAQPCASIVTGSLMELFHRYHSLTEVTPDTYLTGSSRKSSRCNPAIRTSATVSTTQVYLIVFGVP